MNNTSTKLLEDALFQNVQKFEPTILCKDPLTAAADIAHSDLTEDFNLHVSFDNYLSTQPSHVQQFLVNLNTAEVDVELFVKSLTLSTSGYGQW